MIEISREAFERYKPEFRFESKEVIQELEDEKGNRITNRKIQFKLRTLIDN